MKYLIIVIDGAADYKIEKLGYKTPLEVSNIPTINELTSKGEIGLVRTIPSGIAPGSDAANLAIMGFDPSIFLTGRSPLEAASMGIAMSDSDLAFRCNLVSLDPNGLESNDYSSFIMLDHSAGDISTEEAKVLIEFIAQKFDSANFYPGVSYRHCMIVPDGELSEILTPPHDILDQNIEQYLPKDETIKKMMQDSYDLLKDHPINVARSERGLRSANSIWIWGQGKKPQLESFQKKYSLSGATVSAVDLIKGIGVCAGLDAINVIGATGTIHTNFDGKAEATIQALKDGKDFVYVHLEAPDECSHQGDLDGKIKSLELIDQKIVKPLFEYLKNNEDEFKILILPDHETPISSRTHASDPVPYMIYDSRVSHEPINIAFNESFAKNSGAFFPDGYKLADYFFEAK